MCDPKLKQWIIENKVELVNIKGVSYTHLDVYKRQYVAALKDELGAIDQRGADIILEDICASLINKMCIRDSRHLLMLFLKPQIYSAG